MFIVFIVMKKQIRIKKFTYNKNECLVLFSDCSMKKMNDVDIKKLQKCCWFLRQHIISTLHVDNDLYYELFKLEHQDTDFKCYLENPELDACKFCFL